MMGSHESKNFIEEFHLFVNIYRTTAPMHTIASYLPDFPSLSATTPISKLPGTHTTYGKRESNKFLSAFNPRRK